MSNESAARLLTAFYTTGHDRSDELLAACWAVIRGRCQWMQVHWAIDALAEACCDYDPAENVRAQDAIQTAEAELLAAWSTYSVGVAA